MATDYTGKCGTCTHFERNGEYRHGWCHRFPYNENVVCDPKHPYPQRAMSAKCRYYFDGRQTNADHIRAMTDEELAHWLSDIWDCNDCSEHERLGDNPLLSDEQCDQKCEQHCLDWLKQPYGGADHE